MASMDKNLFEFSDDTNMSGGLSQEDLFSLLEMFDDGATGLPPLSPLDEIVFSPKGDNHDNGGLVAIKSTSLSTCANSEIKESPRNKKPKLLPTPSSEEEGQDGEHRILHINVERNRRRQMNDNLSVLRSLMPPFYVKRGDQASIIGGVVDYIKELQQILKSLEMKKQRKIYSQVLSPRVVSSPRPSPLSPIKPPLSPRISLPISPRTPTRTSPYKDTMQQAYMPPTSPYKTTTIQQQGYMSMSPTISTSRDASPSSSVAMKPTAPEVEVKLQGSNVVLQTKSTRIHGQIVKILQALEALSLEILHVSISSLDDTMLNSFTIKIGIECQLSAEELAQEIQQTFC